MKPKKIPIATAKEIASLGYDEIIIVGANYETGIQHVTTYGKTVAACENAAIGGNEIKKLLKWPENMCNTKPARQIKRERYEGMEKVLQAMISLIENPFDDDDKNLAALAGWVTVGKNVVGKK